MPSRGCLDTPQPLPTPRPRFPKYLSAKLLIPGLWHPGTSLRPSATGSQPHHCQDVLCGAPAQLPSFFLQDPRVQEKEVPPPLTPGLWQPSRPSSPLTWDPQEVLPECQREHTVGRGGPWEGTAKEFPGPPMCRHTGKRGGLGGGRNDSGLRKSRRGGACVLLLALFMNVCLWLACVGGVCVSVNECRCVTVNECLCRAAAGVGDGVGK